MSDLIQLIIDCSAHGPSGRGAHCRNIVGGLLSGKLLCIALLVLNGLWTEPTEWILLVSSVYFMTQVSVGSLLNAGRTRIELMLELMFKFSSKKLLCSTYSLYI